MGHCISVYLLKKEDVRNEKLDVILEDKSIGIKLTDLGEGIFATVDIPNFNEFTKGKNIAHITTDYFGGSGNQSATLWVNGEIVYHKSDEQDWSIKPINEVLRLMGVISKSGSDEFDTINLGKYRKNEDFEEIT